MDGYERLVLRRYAANILTPNPGGRETRPNRAVAMWLRSHARVLGIEAHFKLGLKEAIDGWECIDHREPIGSEIREGLQSVVAELRRPSRDAAQSALQERIAWLAKTLSLNRQDAEIVGAVARFAVSKPFQTLHVAVSGDASYDTMESGIIARALRKSGPALNARLRKEMPLPMLGLIERDAYDRDRISLSGTVFRIAQMRNSSPESLRALLFGRAKEAALEWSDFDHLGPPRDLAQRVISAALGRRKKGVNLLLHGAPGTGKTEFVRTLARTLDARAVFVGEADDDDNEPTRGERVSAFMLARAVAGQAGRTILAMDEADDIFLGVDDNGAEGRRGSKVFMNRLVESTEVPVIWITNAPERLGAAVLRRMDLAIAFPQPGRALRVRMVERMLDRRRLKLGHDAAVRLAALDAPPAVIDRAVRMAKLVTGKAAEIELAAGSIMRLLKPETAAPIAAMPIPFDPALSAADVDLVELGGQIAHSCLKTGRMDVSLCLHGLPGTGKSAYARHLASLLGLDVLEKRASDLIGPYVGQTEAQIAAAFREAADKRSMLVLDEADSFLRDRAGATQSWQVTQVNEMLAWMERHPYPFVCTTNLMDSLDPATLRRFVFKVSFMPMSPAQAASAFRSAFGLAPPPSLGSLETLTPGDFAIVARKAAVLGECDGGRLLDLLRVELAAKPGGAARPIGFRLA